ncbi:hypothetical protein GCM10009678_16290 [Actinomadura kijaniata]|uniref:MFS family permease n=1 Tax=Actinomadura namibiensis TaxID=182080 RepID=A0A7W3LIP3_ACTNM|nr:hypothetical protein [Actinomadura namibiensis]MBA8948892.1 MFS family permease [Actinomadura namibiensis]
MLGPVGLATFASLFALPLAGRLSDRMGSRALTQIGSRTGEAGAALVALALGLGCVGAPTMGALYRTPPPAGVPQGGSVLYMLDQLGASVGTAMVAWFACGAVAAVLAVSFLLPGRPREAPGSLVPQEAEVEAGTR